jgi:hypothetical protein
VRNRPRFREVTAALVHGQTTIQTVKQQKSAILHDRNGDWRPVFTRPVADTPDGAHETALCIVQPKGCTATKWKLQDEHGAIMPHGDVRNGREEVRWRAFPKSKR